MSCAVCGDRIMGQGAIRVPRECRFPAGDKISIGRQMMINEDCVYVAVVGQSIQLDGGSDRRFSNRCHSPRADQRQPVCTCHDNSVAPVTLREFAPVITMPVTR